MGLGDSSLAFGMTALIGKVLLLTTGFQIKMSTFESRFMRLIDRPDAD